MTESFTFAFRQPGWLRRVMIGAGFELVPVLIALPVLVRLRHLGEEPYHLPAVLVPTIVLALAARFVVLGYLRRVVRAAATGSVVGLPAWEAIGTDLVAGATLWLVAVGFCLPAAVVSFVTWFVLLELGGAVAAGLGMLTVALPAFAATLALLPAALVAAITEDDPAAAFDLPRVFARLRRAAGPYVLAFLVAFAAEILAQLGLLLCCLGVVPARFLAHCVTAHAFGTAFRNPSGPSPDSRPHADSEPEPVRVE
ncbi:MAG: DUF4013 domain-containing protein [Thermoanaerobaculaceae bacterium]|nr:DUF4013 domain-containing protein [Thermoanaerobaculaceae bacterium]MDI9623082.1 DUF4013 domain-containing protein [Acidobacteriota bacterium]NLH11373.1 DUF4013 domain-containing protein [Holophagae bacterium]HPW55397.1 DUF4013 domain-containing protein [Thermoanaerobaculaceae bacterium]